MLGRYPMSESSESKEAKQSKESTESMESMELQTVIPSEKAIVRRLSDVIATSPRDIKRGEAIFLDKRGRPLARRPFQRLVLAWKVGIYGSLIGGAVLALSGAWLAGAAIYLGGVAPVVWANYRGSHKLAAIDVIVRQGHLEEGQRRLDALPELRRRNAMLYAWVAGSLASHRGDHEQALTWWREALPRAEGLQHERIKLSMANAFARAGRNLEAQRMFESVRLPPEADELLIGCVIGRMVMVLHGVEAMPSSEELHEWARKALEYSHTGVELGAIGWAFEKIGEEEMAQLLASEAVERMHYPYLATWWPELQAWLDARGASGAGAASGAGGATDGE